MGWSLGTLALVLAGCAGPLDRTATQELQEQLGAARRVYAQDAAAGAVVELQRPQSEVDKELSADRRTELDHISGADSYRDKPVTPGKDLAGQAASPNVTLALQQAIQLAVRHSVDVQQARLVPAISQTQITQAQADFDAVFFTNVTYNDLDTPRPPTAPLGQGDTQSQQLNLTTGIKKNLTTGAVVTAQTAFNRTAQIPSVYSASGLDKYTYYDANIQLGITQPLLQGFGEDVNRAKIVLAESARGQAVQDLYKTLLETVANVETAYWKLYFARQRLLIQERLFERTSEDYKRIKQREGFDVNPVRKTEAGSFVELRRAEVLRARQEVRNASDALKRLINAPELPLAGETLVVPADAPADAPIQFSLLDAVTTALRSRPEMHKALMQIQDSSIRLRVADNGRLPKLSVGAALRYNGLSPNALDQAYGSLTDGNYIDYLLSGQFEVPLGNRGPEAQYAQRTLERRLATVTYQKAAQDVVLEVKQAMRSLITSFEVIGAARAARRAAADNLRAIERQEEVGVELTPEFLLDLKLNSQQRLADAETQEVAAVADYNSAVANFYRTLGTLLERNGIKFEDQK